MSETYGAESFGRDVDRLLEAADRDGVGIPDPAYRDDLVLTAELATLDFSDESRLRTSLRRGLLSGETDDAPALMRPRLVAVAATTAVILALAFQPDLRAAIVEPAFDFIKQLFLGDRTQAVLVEKPAPPEMETILAERARELEAGERWYVRTATGSQGGDVPDGASPVIRTYNSLRLAEADAGFAFVKPDVPAPYRFDRAVLTPTGGVILWYRAPGLRLTLSQTSNAGDASTMAMAMGDGATLEEIDLDGVRAAWINDESLVWEDAGVSYDLEGNELTLSRALTIASSLRRPGGDG